MWRSWIPFLQKVVDLFLWHTQKALLPSSLLLWLKKWTCKSKKQLSVSKSMNLFIYSPSIHGTDNQQCSIHLQNLLMPIKDTYSTRAKQKLLQLSLSYAFIHYLFNVSLFKVSTSIFYSCKWDIWWIFLHDEILTLHHSEPSLSSRSHCGRKTWENWKYYNVESINAVYTKTISDARQDRIVIISTFYLGVSGGMVEFKGKFNTKSKLFIIKEGTQTILR